MFSSIIIGSIFVSSLSLVGGLFLMHKQILTQRFIHHLVSFSAGVILTTALLDFLPEALTDSTDAMSIFLPTLLGIVFSFFLERFVLWFHHHDEPHGRQPTIILVLLGDGIHNFMDGIVIAASFLTSTALGIAAIIAITAHEIPQEIADFSVLIHKGLAPKKALFFNFLSALAALTGAILGFFFLQTLQNTLVLTISFSAGMFIYIACADLIPDMHTDFQKQKGWSSSFPFVAGILLMYFLITVLEH